MSRVIFIEHKKDGVLTDALSVTLADDTSTYGIREKVSQVIVVPPGVPVPKVSTGVYEYDVSSLDTSIDYEYVFKVIDLSGQIKFIFKTLPKLVIVPLGSGPEVATGIIGVPVDVDSDGYIDGYAYDLLDHDGVVESFDFNDDRRIDAIDVGSFTSSGQFKEGELDGVPDVPSPKGTPDTEGTFGGTFGFDGTNGEVPATGGYRTNRNHKGTGYWDGISFKDTCTIPIGPRGQCFKDKAHAATRVFLKDTDPTCHAFTEDEVDMYLEASLWAFNAKPTFTAFLWDHMQDRWLDIITKGAVVWALYAQSLIESGREFTITDNGISYTPPPVSDKMQSYASALLQHYDTNLTEIKSNFKPLPAAVGVFSVLDISPSLRRLRHLREKRIF